MREKFAGVNGGEDTPDPLPNSEDKLASGNGNAGETLCESSTMPAFKLKARVNSPGFSFLRGWRCF